MKIIKIGAAIAALLALVACASQPEIPYDRSIAGSKTIGLLTPGWPAGPTSFLASSVGQSFGLVGALVDASIQSGRESDLSKILLDHHSDIGAQFTVDLTADLEKRGYTVVPVIADGKRSNYLKKYPGPAGDIDSYLDVAVASYGYLSAGIAKSDPYRPWLVARVKLVRASDSSVQMQDIVTYNTIGESKNAVTLSPDPQFAFDSWSDVNNEPAKAADGVSDAARKSADAIAALLK